jgi:hypothetical protein
MAPTGAPPEQHPRAGSQATVRQADHPLRQPRGPHGTGRSRRLLGGWTERRGLARWWPCLWRSPAPWVQRSGPSRTSQPRHTALARAISGPDAERGTNSRGDARQAAATAHDRISRQATSPASAAGSTTTIAGRRGSLWRQHGYASHLVAALIGGVLAIAGGVVAALLNNPAGPRAEHRTRRCDADRSTAPPGHLADPRDDRTRSSHLRRGTDRIQPDLDRRAAARKLDRGASLRTPVLLRLREQQLPHPPR